MWTIHKPAGTPLALEYAFFLELCDDALSAPLRAPRCCASWATVERVLTTEESGARARSRPLHSGRAYSMASLIASSMNSTKLSHEPVAPGPRQGLVIICLPPPDRRLNRRPRQHRTPPRLGAQSLPETSRPTIPSERDVELPRLRSGKCTRQERCHAAVL